MGRLPRAFIKRPDDGSKVSLADLARELDLSYSMLFNRYRSNKKISWKKLTAPKHKRFGAKPKPPAPVKKKKKREQVVIPAKSRRKPEEDWNMADEMQDRARAALAEFREG
jgi:hypothetical protein